MDLVAIALPASWTVVAWILVAPILFAAARVAPWERFGASELVHVWYGAIFGLIVLWNIRATVGEGFTFHLSGVAALTLLVGAPLALLGTAIAVAVEVAVRDAPWVNAALAWLAMAAPPVAVTWVVWRCAERVLPPNFFVYVFVVAFFGAALSLIAAALVGAIAFTAGAGRPADVVFGEYLPYLAYLAFGEGTMTGMILTLAVVYRPQWVATFDDARYLHGR